MAQNNVILFPAPMAGAKGVDSRLISSEVVHPSQPVGLLQSNAQLFDILPYLPKGKVVRFIETSKGTHQIPHRVYEFMFKATSTKVELLVFGCLIRFTLGFHRCACNASHSFIAEWTGLAIPNVRRALDSLLNDCLIRRLQVGDSIRNSTIYEVPIVKGYLESLRSSKSVSEQCITDPAVEGKTQQLGLNQSQNYNQIDPSTGINLIPKKDSINIIKEINTLSQTSMSEYLKVYFSNLKPEGKKKREFRHFESLKTDYSEADISDALKSLNEEGIPGTGESCHSPFGFLAFSMESVLAQVRNRRGKVSKKEAQARAEADKKSAEARKEAEESLRSEENRRNFEKAFPTSELQESYLNEFVVRFPFFKKTTFALRAAAIGEWASKQKLESNKV